MTQGYERASFIFLILYRQRLWHLVSSQLLEKKLACVPGHSESFPHTLLFRQSVPFVFASLFRMLLHLLNLTGPCWHRTMRFPAAVILLYARHCWSSVFFQFQTRISNHLEVILVIGLYTVESHDMACCVQFGIFFCPFCNFFCFLNYCVQASGHALSGLVVCWILEGLPCTHVYPSGSLVRKIWNLVVPVHSSE